MSVIIIGGGMAGVTLALALSHLTKDQLAIDLVEAKSPDSGKHPGFDSRSIALAQGTCQQLEQIGIWPVLRDKAEAITDIHVSDRGHFGLVSLSARDYDLPALGQVIELTGCGSQLFSMLKQHANIRVHCPARLVELQRTEQKITITLDNGQQLSGLLAVAADGSHSALATASQIDYQLFDYHQFATITEVKVSQPITGQAFERFTRHGPLALLPMTKERYSLVWCHDIAKQPVITGWQDEQFIAELQHEFGWRLGQINQIGQRHYYPLALRYAKQQISHRVALVSNASQTLHPIAGQGFNLGLRDVMALAHVISDSWRTGLDMGSYQQLRYYQHARQHDRELAIRLTDGLIKLYTDSQPLLAGARNIAMLAMDNSRLLQNVLVRQTIGQFKR